MYFYLLFVNLACAFTGGALIWYGAWLLNSVTAEKIDNDEELAAVICILLGVVIVIATVYGTISTIMRSKTMLISYAVLMVTLLILQIILKSISYSVESDKLPKGLKQGFEQLWDLEHQGNSTLQLYEEWLHCCGRNSANDYYMVDKKPSESCCNEHDCTNVLNLYITGCEEKFREYAKSKTKYFNLISWFIILTELAVSVSACYFVDRIRNKKFIALISY